MSQRQRRAPTRYSPGSGGRRSSLPGLNVQLPPPPPNHTPPEDEALDNTSIQESGQNNVDNTVVVVNIQNSINDVNTDSEVVAEEILRQEPENIVPSQEPSDNIVHTLEDEENSNTENVVESVIQESEDNVNTVGIGHLIRPRIPPANNDEARDIDSDSDGWNLIGRVGAWESMLCGFSVLEEVPYQHEEVWVRVWGEVLRRLSSATTEQDTNHALMWLQFLPQALLRKPPRGGRRGRGEVAKRFNVLGTGDWGTLVELWEKDKERLGSQGVRRRRRQDTEEEKLSRHRKETISLISQGQVSRAMRRVTSHGVASPRDPDIQDQLQSKYPSRGHNLPDRVLKGQPVDNLRGLREALKKLERGVAPGCGGLRSEYLVLLGEKMSSEGFQLLEDFGMKYLTGDLPAWFFTVWQDSPDFGSLQVGRQDWCSPSGSEEPPAQDLPQDGDLAEQDNHQRAPRASATSAVRSRTS